MISKETKKYIDNRFVPTMQKYYLQQQKSNTEISMVILAISFITAVILGIGNTIFYFVAIPLVIGFVYYMYRVIRISNSLEKIDTELKMVE